MPHFMLNNEKVDQFYSFIKDEYYNWWGPDKIILISPNHFHREEKNIKTICESSDVHYKTDILKLSNIDSTSLICDKNWDLFYEWWNSINTNEHWIGEHFQWINKYFPDTIVIPIISPCFQLSATKDILPVIENINGNILVLASVDFAHYQPEEQTLQHDEKSIETLKSMSLKESDFIESIDADCPACLYLIQYLANKQWQIPELRWRDSSSTILWQDMWEENTSRIFMWYE